MLAEQQYKEREKAKRQAPRAKDEQERQEKEQAEQERILNEAGDKVGNVFGGFFKTARDSSTAHKDVMFMSWFYKILEM